MKKVFFLILTIFILIITFIIFTFLPKNYSIEYTINNYFIKESYSKDNGYTFYVDNYYFNISSKYINKRKLIKSVTFYNDYIQIESDYLKFYSYSLENNQISYYNDEINYNSIDFYEDIKIYSYNDYSLFIWSLDGFYLINGNNKTYKLFNKELYEIDLVTKINDDLLIADYSQNAYFNKMYLINSKNGKVSEVSLDRNIYFDSYILGTFNNNVYIYDISSETEYEINPYKEKVSEIEYKVLINDNWENVSKNKLNNKSSLFISLKTNFYIDNNKIFLNINNNKIKISNLDVQKIIYSTNKYCFFLSGDTIYYASYYELKPIVSYSELKFNNKNIYIF